MYKKNRYLDELGIPRRIYSGNFVREKKIYRLSQRYRYGFDYRDIFNTDTSFAEWLHSHMRMYQENSVHDDSANSIFFEDNKYTIEEAVEYIIEKTGAFLKYSYYVDAYFEYKAKHPMIGKLICKFNSAIRLYLDEYDYPEDDGNQIVEDYIRASQLLLEIMRYFWM